MKCPHCLVEFHDARRLVPLDEGSNIKWAVEVYNCPNPECLKPIYYLINADIRWSPNGSKLLIAHAAQTGKEIFTSRVLIYPRTSGRSPIPKEVPAEFANDYSEACLVLKDSPKSSAALSRRCLQHIIRKKLAVEKKTLFSEIEEVLNLNLLPTDIASSLDAIRHIGNFAAHPLDNITTGEIIDVEPEEAEWNLDVLEMLFDYLFVRPAAVQKRKDALNVKLTNAGKKPMI